MSETLISPRGENGFTLFLALVTGRITPDTLWHSPTYRAKFLLRSLAFPRASISHLHQLAVLPEMRHALNIQATLPGKIHRPYLYLGLSSRQRAQALQQHYAFLQQLSCNALRKAMLTPQQTELVSFCGKDDKHFKVTVACNGRCEREGEVNMSLSCDGTLLAIVTFSVIERDGRRVLLIGGMQGAHSETPHETIRMATRACYGLFPKRVLLEVISLLARASGIGAIQAVSNCGHTYYSLRYRYKKRAVFLASYDEFWQSLNAEKVSRQLWQLPLEFPQKTIEEIPSKKRAEYRRRYELLEVLRQQFTRLV